MKTTMRREWKVLKPLLRLGVALCLATVLWALPAVGAFVGLPKNFIPIHTAWAATTANVSVNATPSYIAITNAPSVYDFGVVAAGGTANTSAAEFTITNSSTVNIDINISCDGWTSTGDNWTYINPQVDGGNFDASSDDGGTGGSTGEGDFDISVPSGSTALLCDNVTTVTDPTWELQLDIPSSFTHGDVQDAQVEVSATAE